MVKTSPEELEHGSKEMICVHIAKSTSKMANGKDMTPIFATEE